MLGLHVLWPSAPKAESTGGGAQGGGQEVRTGLGLSGFGGVLGPQRRLKERGLRWGRRKSQKGEGDSKPLTALEVGRLPPGGSIGAAGLGGGGASCGRAVR